MGRKSDAEPGQSGSDQGTNKGAAAEGGVELRHDGPAEFVLDVGAFDVLRDIPQPDADAEEEQRDGGSGNARGGQRKRDPHAGCRGQEPGGTDRICRADSAHNVTCGRQGEEGAERHTQQQRPHLPGGDLQALGHRGDASGPAGENEAVNSEDQERRRGGGLELGRAGCRWRS